ncbi:MAG: response regulator transcription factor, partial [Gammaproteobacteria bacterium]|nr:response regulator transcription factor [Gammaproteobacteria bacterium]
RDLVRTLEYNLHRAGYRTRYALTGEDALREMVVDPLPTLILLDVMLPDIPGTEVCRRVRAKPRTRSIPVLMLSAKGEEISRVVGFESGADDYVVKPFSLRELLLRIQAILRRTDRDDIPSGILRFGDLEMDPETLEVKVNGKGINLSSLEFRLLSRFILNRGRVQSRGTLLDTVWNNDAALQPRTVDVHVKRLREKLGEAGAYIRTIRGVGYRFPARPEEVTA